MSWQTGRLNNSTKYLLHASMTIISKKEDLKSVGELSKVCSQTNCSEMLVLGTDLVDLILLAGEDLTRYRSVVATSNFISQDRPDVRFAVKEFCREMARPTCASW